MFNRTLNNNKRIMYKMYFCLLQFVLVTVACAGQGGGNSEVKQETKASKNIISSLRTANKEVVKQGDEILVSFKVADADSVFLITADGRESADVATGSFKIKTSDNTPVGSYRYSLEVFSNGKKETLSASCKIHPANAPKEYDMKVVKTYPHSVKSYTQGLEFYKGRLYESSGQYDLSFVEYMSFPALKSEKQMFLAPKYFAEGITVLNDKLYLLTWQEKTCFVLDPETLKTLDTYTYDTEGWGITNDGKNLYMSDGSAMITVVSPDGFKPLRRFEVLSSTGAIHSLNELEWINGEIWANVYGYDVILRINPETGVITGIIRVGNLLSAAEITPTTDVLNGIAYNPETKKIYITGKNWPKIFEIELTEIK